MNSVLSTSLEPTCVNPEPDRAAALCYRGTDASIEFLLIRSHAGGWIFPKGRIEAGETAWQAAQREAFEEAGVTGAIEHEQLCTFRYFKRASDGSAAENLVAAFLLLVGNVQPAQEKERKPTWFSAQEAGLALVHNRQFQYGQELSGVIDMAVASLMKMQSVE